jgi:hypothetical protein
MLKRVYSNQQIQPNLIPTQIKQSQKHIATHTQNKTTKTQKVYPLITISTHTQFNPVPKSPIFVPIQHNPITNIQNKKPHVVLYIQKIMFMAYHHTVFVVWFTNRENKRIKKSKF